MRSKQSQEFEERFIRFSVGIIKMVTGNTRIPRSVSEQIIRSATSIGANYAEAQNAVSRQDFKNKISISKKEAAETRYWLKVIEKLATIQEIAPYLKESQEILLVLQKIVTTLRTKSAT